MSFKLSSGQFALCIATLCVVAGGSYRLGQRSHAPDVVYTPALLKLVPFMAPTAVLLGDDLTERSEDLVPRTPLYPFQSTGGENRGLQIIYRSLTRPGSVGQNTRVRVLRTEGDLSKVQVLTRGISPNRAVYVVTSELRTTDGSRTFSPFEQATP